MFWTRDIPGNLQDILCPIATTVQVEHKYSEAVHGLSEGKLTCGHTGIGDAMMWHGFPDALVNSVTICSWDAKTDDELEYHSGSNMQVIAMTWTAAGWYLVQLLLKQRKRWPTHF